jgi:leucyl aminopeptidase
MSLNLSLLRAHPAEIDADAVIVAIHEDGSLSEAARALDERSGGRISALVASNDASGKPGRCLLTHGLANVRAARVLLVGVGEIAKLDTGRYAKLCLDAMRALKGTPVKRAWSALPELVVNGRDAGWALRQAALAADHVGYAYTATRKAGNGGGLEHLMLAGDAQHAPALAQAAAIAQGVRVARELGNLPPNICNPAYLAEQSRKIASEHDGVECEVLERDAMAAARHGLAAARGARLANRAAPDRAEVDSRAAATPSRYVLVGKGITFDTGGIIAQTRAGMEEMKFDMCGAAACSAPSSQR